MEGSIKRHEAHYRRLVILSLAAVIMVAFMLSACEITTPSLLNSPKEGAPAAGLQSSNGAITQTTPITPDNRPLAARVNGQPIYMDGYEKQVGQMQKAFEDRGMLGKGDQATEQLKQIRHDVLEGMIEQALIEQGAKANNIAISDEELEKYYQQSIEVAKGEANFKEWLAKNDMTEEEYRNTLRSQLLTSKMIEWVVAQAPTSAEQVHARHILVADEATAQKVLERLKAGEDFISLAQELSQDEATRANGGDLGWFPAGLDWMVKEVEQAAFSLQPGQLSGIVHSAFGYHIVKVEAREANRPLTPEMLQSTKREVFRQWLDQQKAAAAIERFA